MITGAQRVVNIATQAVMNHDNPRYQAEGKSIYPILMNSYPCFHQAIMTMLVDEHTSKH